MAPRSTLRRSHQAVRRGKASAAGTAKPNASGGSGTPAGAPATANRRGTPVPRQRIRLRPWKKEDGGGGTSSRSSRTSPQLSRPFRSTMTPPFPWGGGGGSSVLLESPFLSPPPLVDGLAEHEPGPRLVPHENVTVNEDFFQGISPARRSCRCAELETLTQVRRLVLLDARALPWSRVFHGWTRRIPQQVIPPTTQTRQHTAAHAVQVARRGPRPSRRPYRGEPFCAASCQRVAFIRGVRHDGRRDRPEHIGPNAYRPGYDRQGRRWRLGGDDRRHRELADETKFPFASSVGSSADLKYTGRRDVPSNRQAEPSASCPIHRGNTRLLGATTIATATFHGVRGTSRTTACGPRHPSATTPRWRHVFATTSRHQRWFGVHRSAGRSTRVLWRLLGGPSGRLRTRKVGNRRSSAGDTIGLSGGFQRTASASERALPLSAAVAINRRGEIKRSIMTPRSAPQCIIRRLHPLLAACPLLRVPPGAPRRWSPRMHSASSRQRRFRSGSRRRQVRWPRRTVGATSKGVPRSDDAARSGRRIPGSRWASWASASACSRTRRHPGVMAGQLNHQDLCRGIRGGRHVSVRCMKLPFRTPRLIGAVAKCSATTARAAAIDACSSRCSRRRRHDAAAPRRGSEGLEFATAWPMPLRRSMWDRPRG